jgi:hypothetical protein
MEKEFFDLVNDVSLGWHFCFHNAYDLRIAKAPNWVSIGKRGNGPIQRFFGIQKLPARRSVGQGAEWDIDRFGR